MHFIEQYRRDFEHEMPPTRKMLERVPDDRVEWKPHPKSFPIGHLAQLIARMPSWLVSMATQSTLDLSAQPPYSFETTQGTLREFDEAVATATAVLAVVQASQLDGMWSLMAHGHVVVSQSRMEALSQTLRHLTHHRGQLSVYLRLIDVPVPITYGPTADDRGPFGL